jgi:DNA-binding response OmpR family regulator
MVNNTKRILLLDDDYESMLPLKNFLEAVHGFQVELTAEKGLIERLQTECFDLICVDVMIHPISLNASNQEVKNIHFDQINWRRTGLVFVKRLHNGEFNADPSKGTSPQVPVIVLSAVADPSEEDAINTYPQTTKYMEKPFDLEELVERIYQLLRETSL